MRRAPTLSRPTWILGLTQTAARGRRGRAWVHPKGNFAATLVFRPSGGPEQAALRSFVTALALFDAVATVTGRVDGLSLKWPNDVLLNGGKLAGILLESVGAPHGVHHLAIGIGVNLADAPSAHEVETHAVPPVSLGGNVGPEDFLEHLASAYAFYETQFQTFGFEPIRTAWLARAARLGETITARTGNTETVGVFETVDVNGALVLKTPKGRQSLAAADIFF